MPYLEIRLGPDTLLLRFVGRIDFVFGRLPKADIQLRDMKVSRLHTQVFIDSHGAAYVRDLGSSGGTGYNNKKLPKGVVAPLVDGVKIRVGESRVTYYDSEPPVNAIDPPGISSPRGLIRTNERPRVFEADATVIAAEKVSKDTASGPAEAPPIVRPEDFTEDAQTMQPSKKQPAASSSASQKRKDTGIVEAPWEKSDGSSRQDPSEMVEGSASQPGIKKPGTKKITGRLQTPATALPADGVNPNAPTAAVKPGTAPPAAPAKPPASPPSTGAGAFSPPPPPPKRKRGSGDSAGMPTISLGDAPTTDPTETGDDHDPLTDTQIAHYLGGGDSGQFDTPDFGLGKIGDAQPKSEKITDEVVFGPGARMDEVDADIETDSVDNVPSYDDAGTPPPTNERGASDDRAFKPRKTRKLMKRRTDKITNKTHTPPPSDGKTEYIPKPDNMETAVASESAKDSEKATGKPKAVKENLKKRSNMETMAEGPGGDTVAMDMDLLADMRKKLEAGETVDGLDVAESREDVDEMAAGPGGDTVAMDMGMLADMRKQLEKAEADKKAKADSIEMLGDSETIKTVPDDDIDDNEEDSDIPDVSGSSGRHSGNFQEEADDLPEDKKAAESPESDTIRE